MRFTQAHPNYIKTTSKKSSLIHVPTLKFYCSTEEYHHCNEATYISSGLQLLKILYNISNLQDFSPDFNYITLLITEYVGKLDCKLLEILI